MRLPRLGREVPIDIYLVHVQPDPNGYFFVFDFEEFVAKSRTGLFSRPKLRLWSGRDDFDRAAFAKDLRVEFSRAFDAARAAQADAERRGWFEIPSLGTLAASLVSGVILAVATGVGRAVFGSLRVPSWMRSRSDAEALEAEIEATKARVDAALRDLEVRLHPDLYVHAHRFGGAGPMTGMERAAWPLPAEVTAAMDEVMPRVR